MFEEKRLKFRVPNTMFEEKRLKLRVQNTKFRDKRLTFRVRKLKFEDKRLTFRVQNMNNEVYLTIIIQYLVLKDTLRDRQNTLTLEEWTAVATTEGTSATRCLGYTNTRVPPQPISIPISAHAGGLCTYSDTLTGCWGLVSGVN
ncbi:MAG: hypothetical protein ACR2LR_25720 [Hassallia sp.]